MIRTDLGLVTAYAYAVEHGQFSGTEEEFGELQANSATNAANAAASASSAAASAAAAETASGTAVMQTAISGEILMESGTFADSDGKTKNTNTARQRNITPICIDNLAGISIPDGYEIYVFCLNDAMSKIGVASSSWYSDYFNIFNCLNNTRYINIALRKTSAPSSDISSEVIRPVYLRRNGKNVIPVWNVDVGGIYIDGDSIIVNQNGFGVAVDGKRYYVAPTDMTSITPLTPPVLTNYYNLAIDMTVAVPGVRNNPSDVLKFVDPNDRDANSERYIVVANYYQKRWYFVGPFEYFYQINNFPVEPDYVAWNTSRGGIKIMGNSVVVNENGFCIAYNGKIYYIAPTDMTTVTTFTASDSTQHLVIDPAALTTPNGRNNPTDVMSVVNYIGPPGVYNKKYIYVASFYKTYWDFCGKFIYFDEPVFSNGVQNVNPALIEEHIIAHMGGNVGEENTIANFRTAISNGYKVVECDVQFTSDSVPVLRHEDYVTAGGTTYYIAQNTYSTLHAAKPSLATLEELLILAKKNNLSIDIDFTKTYTTAQTKILYDTIAKHGAFGRCMITCFATTARQLLSYSRNLVICISSVTSTYNVDIIEDIIRKAALCYCSIGYGSATADLLTYMHTHGALTKLWTLNDASLLDGLIGIGADMFISDSIRDSAIAG